MQQRSSALLFSVLALVSIAAASMTVSGPARSADECITNPNRAAPQGQHWYYRRDQATRRQCWFLAPKGAKVQKTPTHDAKQRVPDAPALQPVPPPAPPPAVTKPSVATAAPPAEAVYSESALLLRWPETVGYSNAPSSFAPSSTVVVAEVAQASDLIAPAPPASVEPTQEPQGLANASSSERANTPVESPALPHEPDHTLAVTLIALALLTIAGLVWYAGFWPRRRETRDRADLAWLQQSRPNRVRGGSPLDDRQTEATARPRAPSSPPEPFDWSQEFAKAWQQLSEDCQTSRTRPLSASRT